MAASSAPVHARVVPDQPARLAALRATGLLTSQPSPVLDRLARVATRLLGVPVALVSLVDDERQWFPGLAGLTGPVAETRQTPLTRSFCEHVVAGGAALAVDDAATHPLGHDHPAIGGLDVQAYLGVPLTDAAGITLGALCAIDAVPRRWTAADREGLTDLAAAVDAELRRRERERRLQLAVDATQEVLYTHDYATGHVERHGAVEAFYGRPGDQLAATSEDWLACVCPHDRARVARSWEATLARGTGRWLCEYRMRHPDGTVVVVEDRARIVTDAAGDPMHVAGALRDVTRERAAEAAVQASEARWRHLLEVAYEGICTVDAGGRVTYANPRLAAMLGCAREALEGVDFFDLLEPAEVPAARERFARRGAGAGEARELRLRRPDGTTLWAHKASSPVFAVDGTFAGALYLFSDVTARREAEAERAQAALALRESEARLRLALDVTGLVVWERDLASDGIRDLTPPSAAACVRAADLGTYAAFLDAVHVEDRDRVARANAEAVASGGDFTVEYRIRGADGGVRWQRTVGGVVAESDEGAGRRLVGVTLDVTEQHTLEERLRQAQKMEAVGQMAGGIAHDFNNLLTVITGNLEFLRADLPAELPADHPARQDAAEMAEAAERARALVRQLLSFSRKQPVSAQPLRLGAVVHGAEKLLRRVIGEEIVLRVEVERSDEYVEGDAGQLEQVLMNLAVNARDAMLTPRHGHSGRGGTLTLAADTVTLAAAEARAWGAAGPGRWARLRVVDTGHGMDAATRAHAFEPFFTTKDVGAGTGLGLATVFGIVRQAGGTIQLDSAPGRGTTCTILLPIVAAGPERSSAHPARRLPAVRATVLLVEDEPAVRVTARRLLERRGYTVREAVNGTQALRVWAEYGDDIDVVVTDVRMPELGGPELVAQLRAARPGLPVVFTSGYTGADPRGTRTGSADREAFVAKPFTGDAMLEAVAQVLGATKRARARER
jgi:PAS domain S-box-containing protein